MKCERVGSKLVVTLDEGESVLVMGGREGAIATNVVGDARSFSFGVLRTLQEKQTPSGETRTEMIGYGAAIGGRA